MDLLYSVRTLAVDYFILSQCTGLTERYTDFGSKTVRKHSQ